MSGYTEHDRPECFDSLPRERQDMLLEWIYNNLAPIKTFNDSYTSYGLKHLVYFENGEDAYFTNRGVQRRYAESGLSCPESGGAELGFQRQPEISGFYTEIRFSMLGVSFFEMVVYGDLVHIHSLDC